MHEADERIETAVLFRDGKALFLRFEEILFGGGNGGGAVHSYTAFKLEIKTAKIHIRRADGGNLSVADDGLRMDKAGGVFKNFHARSDQLAIVGPCGEVNEALVPAVRRDDANVYAAFCGKTKLGYHAVFNDEIGRHDIDALFCFCNHVRVYVLADIFFVKGHIGIGLNKAFRVNRCIEKSAVGVICSKFLGVLFSKRPHLQKDHRGTPGGRSFQADAIILPMSKGADLIDVFISKIESAHVSDLAVDGNELSVVAVVVRGDEKGAERIEFDAADTLGGKLLCKVARQTEKTSHVIVNDAHLYARCGFLFQNVMDAIPHLAAFDDEKFEKDVFFRVGKIGDEGVEIDFAQGQIICFCITVNGKSADIRKIADISRLIGQLFAGESGLFRRHGKGGQRAYDDLLHFTAQLFGVRLQAEKQIEKSAEDGEDENQKDPR